METRNRNRNSASVFQKAEGRRECFIKEEKRRAEEQEYLRRDEKKVEGRWDGFMKEKKRRTEAQ